MQTQTWQIEPLKGKYYGTKIRNIETDELIEVWLNMEYDYKPSSREIADGWQPDWGYDHVELQRSYEAAKIICAALNESLK